MQLSTPTTSTRRRHFTADQNRKENNTMVAQLDQAPSPVTTKRPHPNLGNYFLDSPLKTDEKETRDRVDLDALERKLQSGWVLVPKVPTKEMIDAAWADAHEEDAAGVWREMINAATK